MATSLRCAGHAGLRGLGGCRHSTSGVGVENVARAARRHADARPRARGLSRPLVLAVGAVVLLAGAGTAAYEVAGRGSAHAHPAPARVYPAAVSVDASAAPGSVAYGGTVTVAAMVTSAAGVPLVGERLEIVSSRGDTPAAVAVVASGLSDASGRVAATFRPAATSNLWARYPGSGTWAPAVSLVSRVDVVQKVSVRASVRPAGAGRWVANFTGAVTPARAGDKVRLERRLGATWRLEAERRVTGAGAFTFSRSVARAGTHEYRAVRVADATYGEAAARVTVRARAVAAPPRPSKPGPAIGTGGGGAGPRLLVTGDSLAYFLGQQLATARRGLATVVDSHHSSGLARPDFFDWTAYARGQVARHKPTSVVIFLGGNDCQPLRRNGTGSWTAVGTASWSAEYQRRAAELMRVYTGAGARVQWLGLPIAKDPEISSCYRMLNAATTAAARSVTGVSWTETWSLYAVNGRYSDYVQGVLARQEDGIHLTFEGTRFATRMVMGLLGR